MLLERGTADIVEFPSIHDGNPTLCSLLLGGSGLMLLGMLATQWDVIFGGPHGQK